MPGVLYGHFDVPEIKFMLNLVVLPQPGTLMAAAQISSTDAGNAVALDVGDADEAYFFNCFAFGYGIGARFQKFSRGCYGA